MLFLTFAFLIYFDFVNICNTFPATNTISSHFFVATVLKNAFPPTVNAEIKDATKILASSACI